MPYRYPLLPKRRSHCSLCPFVGGGGHVLRLEYVDIDFSTQLPADAAFPMTSIDRYHTVSHGTRMVAREPTPPPAPEIAIHCSSVKPLILSVLYAVTPPRSTGAMTASTSFMLSRIRMIYLDGMTAYSANVPSHFCPELNCSAHRVSPPGLKPYSHVWHISRT